MSDRPGDDSSSRPQYGEYASAEEQRARIRHPDATGALDSGQSPDEAPAPFVPSPEATRSGARRGPVVDRVITAVLLALGLFNVLTTAPGLFFFDEQLRAVLALFDIDTPLADPAGARQWGAIAGVVMIFGYLLTVMFTLWWMRRGRVAFWIPLVGAAVTTIAMAVLVNVPLTSDPAFLEFTDRILGFSVGG